MKKIFLILTLFLFVNNVSAELLPNNYNDTTSVYDNATISYNYTLDISDSVSYFKTDFRLKKSGYPYTLLTVFKDDKNNILKIQEKYNLINGFPFDTVSKNSIVSFNDKIINIDFGSSYIFVSEPKNYTIYNPFETENSFDLYYKISPNTIIRQGAVYKLNTNMFINKINFQNISGVFYNHISIEYNDNGIAIIQSSLSSAFDSYNPIFKIIFIFIDGLLKFYNIFTGGTESDFLLAKQSFIGEGSLIYYLNFMLTTVLTILHWIFTMGILWFFSIITMAIFIYAYSQCNNNMLLCFRVFTVYEKIFIMTVFVNPITWLYTKVILFWTGK